MIIIHYYCTSSNTTSWIRLLRVRLLGHNKSLRLKYNCLFSEASEWLDFTHWVFLVTSATNKNYTLNCLM